MCGDTLCIESISPENYYALLTIASFLLLLPLTAIFESNTILNIFQNINNNASKTNLIYKNGLFNTFVSGILFYLYNEISFKGMLYL